MGADKAALPFGDETLLARVVGIVSHVAEEVWIVAREGQTLPSLGERPEVRMARDPAEGRGPLAGLAAGLGAMRAERAFVTACDTPLLKPVLIEHLFALAEGHTAAVPEVGGHQMTMCAIYAKALLPATARLLARDELRPRMLLREPGVRIVSEDELRAVDPKLDSLRDCNTPAAYEAALRVAGIRG